LLGFLLYSQEGVVADFQAIVPPRGLPLLWQYTAEQVLVDEL
jgi:hypothetical protein